jgi:hypothetical protein
MQNSLEIAALITSAILSSGAFTFFIKYGVKTGRDGKDD